MPALTEPVSLALAKQHLRISAADMFEDELIGGYIRAAREWVEQFTGHIMIRRPVTETFGGFGQLVTIAARPVHSVVSVTYMDGNGVSQVYVDARLIGFAGRNIVLPALGATWPWATGAAVTLDAGYDQGDEPAQAIDAILLLIAGRYADRETGGLADDVARAAMNCCASLRPVRI